MFNFCWIVAVKNKEQKKIVVKCIIDSKNGKGLKEH